MWLPLTNERALEVNCVNLSWGFKSQPHNSPHGFLPCVLFTEIPWTLLLSDWRCSEGHCSISLNPDTLKNGEGKRRNSPLRDTWVYYRNYPKFIWKEKVKVDLITFQLPSRMRERSMKKGCEFQYPLPCLILPSTLNLLKPPTHLQLGKSLFLSLFNPVRPELCPTCSNTDILDKCLANGWE